MQYALSRSTPVIRTTLSLRRSAQLCSSISIPARISRQLPRRISSCTSGREHDLFNYTSGRWLVNEYVRLAERMRKFNVDELCRLAAQSVGRTLQDVDIIVKLDEGGFNRIFLITMQDGFKMIARIPYPVMAPKFYAVASEVATMRFLRAKGLPVPEVYDYSPTPNNAAETEYIFMEYVAGTKLTDIWMELEAAEIASVVRQMVELEARIMAIPFPASGSLYYADDLQKAPRKTMGIPIPLGEERFCVGPDARLPMWYGRRSHLDVDRGPYENAEAALAAVAYKEAAYLERFGRPLLPFQRERREAYEYKEQSPLDHIKNLELYRRMAPLLVPKKASLRAFCMRHPDIQPSNIMVSTSSDSSGSGPSRFKIVSLLDWQHTAILPLFLLAGIPGRLQNYDDPGSYILAPPSLPEDMDKLDESDRTAVYGRYHARLVHYHYAKSTMELNEPHHDASWDPASTSSAVSSTVLVLPGRATERWAVLAGVGVPCPVEFETEDVSKTKAFSERLQLSDENYAGCQAIIGFETETWVPNEHYERAKALAELLKLNLLQRISAADVRDKAQAHWFLDDMNEDDYM
ncbi:hypothetical protein ONZ51_g3133 [Trametes cubensis]|uniref:Aminoglycoside phosphotransferase domain-containing protein n=1 Tax=Trametes cubensis TaxID=1111947 RepID=A0AAD7U0Q1_9APHY|nr:hypothetical protein ONZ51_g3133 [Trametes cubensis]